MPKSILFFFLGLVFSFRLFAAVGEAELLVELESFKNEVKVQGYSKDLHDQLVSLYEGHKSNLQSYDPVLKREFAQILKASQMVQGLKSCVDTGHEVINKSIDSLFTGFMQTSCLDQYFGEPKVDELMGNLDRILEVQESQTQINPAQMRKKLFDEGVGDLIRNYQNAVGLFSDTEDRFKGSGEDIFPLLPSEMRPTEIKGQASAPTYSEKSDKVLGPISDLYKEVYGDRAQMALSDQWTEVYSSNDQDQPHIFQTDLDPEKSKSALAQCLERSQKLSELQQEAADYFDKLEGAALREGISGFIERKEGMDKPFEELGFQGQARCHSVSPGVAGRPNLDRFGKPLGREDFDEGRLEDLAYSGKNVILTLGNLGEDPHSNIKPRNSQNLETRSFLGPYTENGIKEKHVKALEGMQGFINHMGRRVYNTSDESRFKEALNLFGDGANIVTSLGNSDEVDVALLLMANPKLGMKTLINTPGAMQSFCDSFKTLRNQRNVTQILEVAAAVSMFTGVGGMVAKGGSMLSKGLRVSNLAFTRVDTLSIFDTLTNARDMALSNACMGGDQSLCKGYLDSDRNFTVALAGLVFSGGDTALSGGRLALRRVRQALSARKGSNVTELISDQQKFSRLLTSSSDDQKKVLASVLGRRDLKDDEVSHIVHLLQNSSLETSQGMLTQLAKLSKNEQKTFIDKLISKSYQGGSCRLP